MANEEIKIVFVDESPQPAGDSGNFDLGPPENRTAGDGLGYSTPRQQQSGEPDFLTQDERQSVGRSRQKLTAAEALSNLMASDLAAHDAAIQEQMAEVAKLQAEGYVSEEQAAHATALLAEMKSERVKIELEKLAAEEAELEAKKELERTQKQIQETSEKRAKQLIEFLKSDDEKRADKVREIETLRRSGHLTDEQAAGLKEKIEPKEDAAQTSDVKNLITAGFKSLVEWLPGPIKSIVKTFENFLGMTETGRAAKQGISQLLDSAVKRPRWKTTGRDVADTAELGADETDTDTGGPVSDTSDALQAAAKQKLQDEALRRAKQGVTKSAGSAAEGAAPAAVEGAATAGAAETGAVVGGGAAVADAGAGAAVAGSAGAAEGAVAAAAPAAAALGPIAIAAAAVVAVFAALVVATKMLFDVFSKQADELEEYSAAISIATAEHEAERELSKLDRANRIGGATAQVQGARNRIDDAMFDLWTSMLELLAENAPTLEVIADTVTAGVRAADVQVELLQIIVDLVTNGGANLIQNLADLKEKNAKLGEAIENIFQDNMDAFADPWLDQLLNQTAPTKGVPPAPVGGGAGAGKVLGVGGKFGRALFGRFGLGGP